MDIVNIVDAYPPENSEMRSLDQRLSRGGNATNTLVILSQLGHQCHWAGTLADDLQSELIKKELDHYQIGLEHVLLCPGGNTPTSCVLLNRPHASRTIIHHRSLPEYPSNAFKQIDLSTFDWVHFEGRNVEELEQCLDYATHFSGLRLSLEVEKPRTGIEMLFSSVDLLLFSREYAKHRGYEHPGPFLDAVHRELGESSSVLVCAWGESGASMVGIDAEKTISPAFPPALVTDTLGAGDVFNAAMIDQLGRGVAAESALKFACRLAGRKCGVPGFELSDITGEGA